MRYLVTLSNAETTHCEGKGILSVNATLRSQGVIGSPPLPGVSKIVPDPVDAPPRNPMPDISQLMAWEEDGGCEATDGCWVEPDGSCEHGCQSWLLALGMI